MAFLNHFNDNGDAVMVDVTDKENTSREALAEGRITMSKECFDKIKKGDVAKGDVLCVARIAGIMGAKKTSEIIPLCHIINITKAEIDFEMINDDCAIKAICRIKTIGKTGVEMEALMGVSTALLTIYDMCKAVDKSMEIGYIHLCEKSGGKSGDYKRQLWQKH